MKVSMLESFGWTTAEKKTTKPAAANERGKNMTKKLVCGCIM